MLYNFSTSKSKNNKYINGSSKNATTVLTGEEKVSSGSDLLNTIDGEVNKVGIKLKFVGLVVLLFNLVDLLITVRCL